MFFVRREKENMRHYEEKARRPLNKRAAVFLLMAMAVSFMFLWGIEDAAADENDMFFSSGRVSLREELILRLRSGDNGRAQKDIAEFAEYYSSASRDFSRGDFDGALENFLKARAKWPEYFYADLSAALCYEKLGKYNSAARYYKSYLNKLRSYQRGDYGISASLITSFARGPVEDYDYAYGAVKRRLSREGIDIDAVRPVYLMEGMAPAAFFWVVSAVLTLATFFIAVPFLKKKIREKNPPEGFWVCRACGAFSPELSFVCSSCSAPRPSKEGKGG